jgi:hypothetical protein
MITPVLCAGGQSGEPDGDKFLMFANGRNPDSTTGLPPQQPIPIAGTFQNLYVRLSAAPGGSATRNMALYANGSPQALAVAFGSADTQQIDNADSFHAAAGDNGAWHWTEANTPAAAGPVQIGCVFLSDAANESVIWGSGSTEVSGGTWYMPFGGSQLDTTEAGVSVLMPTSGTIDKLYVRISVAPGTGNSFTYTLMKNGVATGLTCTISDANTTASDTTAAHAVTVGQADTISVRQTQSGTVPDTRAFFGCRWVPTYPGEVPVFSHWFNNAPTANVDNFFNLSGQTSTAADTEANAYNILPCACAIKKLTIKTSVPPGTGKSLALSLRANGATPANGPAITLNDSTQSGADNVNVYYGSPADLVAMLLHPSSTATTTSQIKVSAVVVYQPPTLVRGFFQSVFSKLLFSTMLSQPLRAIAAPVVTTTAWGEAHDFLSRPPRPVRPQHDWSTQGVVLARNYWGFSLPDDAPRARRAVQPEPILLPFSRITPAATPQGWERFFDQARVKPLTAAEQQWPSLQGTVASIAPQGWEGFFDQARAKLLVASEQQWPSFQVEGTVVSITPQGWERFFDRSMIPPYPVTQQRWAHWQALGNVPVAGRPGWSSALDLVTRRPMAAGESAAVPKLAIVQGGVSGWSSALDFSAARRPTVTSEHALTYFVALQPYGASIFFDAALVRVAHPAEFVASITQAEARVTVAWGWSQALESALARETAPVLRGAFLPMQEIEQAVEVVYGADWFFDAAVEQPTLPFTRTQTLPEIEPPTPAPGEFGWANAWPVLFRQFSEPAEFGGRVYRFRKFTGYLVCASIEINPEITASAALSAEAQGSAAVEAEAQGSVAVTPEAGGSVSVSPEVVASPTVKEC